MGSKGRGPGSGGSIPWRAISFLLMAGAVFTALVTRHQMHQEGHMSFLEAGAGRGFVGPWDCRRSGVRI
jgi:hypothetical protein